MPETTNPVAVAEEQYIVPVGRFKVDIRQVVRDIRGVEELVRFAVSKDWQGQRWSQFKQRMYPFADAADIGELDKVLLGRCEPLYTSSEGICTDCPQGPCDLDKARGRCGLESDNYQAKLSLRVACKGCLSMVQIAREVVDYALRLFGKDHPISLGTSKFLDEADLTIIGMFTGMCFHHPAYPGSTLEQLARAIAYVERQLTKLTLASYVGTGSISDLEGMVFHAGSMALCASSIMELAKINGFGFANSGNLEQMELIDFPKVTSTAGLGSTEKGKPVILFTGDNFLPAWVVVKLLKEQYLTERVEVAGIGPVGDDGMRFYDRFRALGPMMQATKIIRSGIGDVLVGTTGCINLDILSEAGRTDTRVIWTGREDSLGLKDRTDDPADEIVKDLVGGAAGVWIRHPDKAAEVAVKAVQQIKRKGNYVMSDSRVKVEAKQCRPDCDLCFTVCPNSLLINQAVKKAQTEGIKALAEVEKGCFFCGRCEEACPVNIPLRDMIVAAQQGLRGEEKFLMRAGRGRFTRQEAVTMAFSLAQNLPGFLYLLGCGNANPDEVAWIANEATGHGFATLTAGCAGTQIARYYDEVEKKYIYKKFPSEMQPRNLVNCGACSATCHLHDEVFGWVRVGTYVSHYANYAETVDVMYTLWLGGVIIWGGLPDRMYALAAGLARSGHPVIIGPITEFGWKRHLLGDKWDYKKWYVWDVLEKRYRVTEPFKKHLIIPVETKEEAVTMLKGCIFYPSSVADTQVPHLEHYIGWHDTFFGDLPDDFNLYCRGPLEFPLRYKARMIKVLGEQYGWETGRMMVVKPKHPDGRLLDWADFRREYSAVDGRATTALPHRVRPEKLKPEEGK